VGNICKQLIIPIKHWRFIDGLKKDGLYDNSLILIWGDHGSFQNIISALSPDNLNQIRKPSSLYKNLDVAL